MVSFLFVILVMIAYSFFNLLFNVLTNIHYVCHQLLHSSAPILFYCIFKLCKLIMPFVMKSDTLGVVISIVYT